MDREHLSGWAFHLCAPDLSRLSSSHLSLARCTVYISQLPDPASSQGAPGLRGMSAYCPGSLRWVGACLKVTFPEGHSLPRFRVITAPLMLLPSPEETVPLLIILPHRPILNVISYCMTQTNTPSLIQSLFCMSAQQTPC